MHQTSDMFELERLSIFLCEQSRYLPASNAVPITTYEVLVQLHECQLQSSGRDWARA